MILPCLSYAGLQVCMDSHWTPQNLSALIRTRTKYKSRLQWPTFIMIRLVGRVLAVAWSAPAPRPPPAIGVEVQPTMQYLGEDSFTVRSIHKLQITIHGRTLMIFHCLINFLPRLSTFPQTEDIWGCFSPVRLLPQCRTPVARPYKQRINDCA